MSQLPKGSHQQISSMSTAKSFSEVPSDSRGVLLQAMVADVRVTFDGTTTPDGSTGFLLRIGDPPFPWVYGNLSLLKFYESSGSAVVEAQFV